MGGGHVFRLKLIELKCLLDSRETTQMRDIDFLHEPEGMWEARGGGGVGGDVAVVQWQIIW